MNIVGIERENSRNRVEQSGNRFGTEREQIGNRMGTEVNTVGT